MTPQQRRDAKNKRRANRASKSEAKGSSCEPPVPTTPTPIDQIIRELGVSDPETDAHLRHLMGEAHAGAIGNLIQGALLLRDKGEICFLEFKKVSPTQVSVQMGTPTIPLTWQRAIIDYLGSTNTSAEEIRELCKVAKALKPDERRLLMTNDGSPTMEMFLRDGLLVFEESALEDALWPPEIRN